MSNKVSIRNLLVATLRDADMSKKDAEVIAKNFVNAVESHLLTSEGELSIGILGKLIVRSYAAAEKYNPGKGTKERRPAYKAVRFKAYQGAKLK